MTLFHRFTILCLLGLAGDALAETTQCTAINSLPAVVSSQGIHCLTRDLSTAISSGAAVTIAANNVTIDCNGWKIGGLAGGPATTATGISSSGRQNVTIRNCGVRGFQTGIRLSGGAGHAVEGNRVDNSTYEGIALIGTESVAIRDNQVLDTGGAPGREVAGISLHSSNGVRVADNLVHRVAAAGGNLRAWGISYSGNGHLFQNNHLYDLAPAGTGGAYGIQAFNAGNEIQAVFTGNVVQNPVARSGTGIWAGSLSHCRGNSVRNFSTGMTSCADGGGNVATSGP